MGTLNLIRAFMYWPKLVPVKEEGELETEKAR